MAKNQQPSGETVVDRLLHSTDPSIVLRTRLEILGESLRSKRVGEIQEQISRSDRVRTLLSELLKNGTLPWHPYSKWYGAHWVLSSLADLGHPGGDKSLIALREQVYAWLFSESHLELSRKRDPCSDPQDGIHGAVRAHASMEGNALYYLTKLGLSDDRTRVLSDTLVDWQWPDGGWNCDRRPKAHSSSFTESLWPLRGLVHYTSSSATKRSYRDAIEKAVEFFLQRKLHKRMKDGTIINKAFTKLRYPCYWHYDILFALKVMKEAGRLKDERCLDAISVLKSKKLDDGGFPAEGAYYRVSKSRKALTGRSTVSWGGTSRESMNEFVTVDALSVLADM